MESIDFSKVTISKPRNFQSNDGQFCFVNNDTSKLIVDIKGCKLAYNVDMSYAKPNMYFYSNQKLTNFNEQVKHVIIKGVYSMGLYGNTLNVQQLEEMYCDPRKIKPVGKIFQDTIKCKLVNKTDIPLTKKSKVNITIHVVGVWISEYSFGPYYNVTDVEAHKDVHTCLIVENESDNESDIEINSC